MNASAFAAAHAATAAPAAAPPPALARCRPGQRHTADPRIAGLHRAAIRLPAFRRAGAHAAARPLAALRAVFLPGAMFCRIRWQANDYGTVRWQLMVMQAATPLDAMQRIPVRPGARACCCTPKAKTRCACWNASTQSTRRASPPSTAARVLAHAGQPSGGPSGAARIHRRAACRLVGREDAPMTTISTTGPRAYPLAPARSHRAGGLRRRRPRCAGLGAAAAAAPDLQPVRQRSGRLVSRAAD